MDQQSNNTNNQQDKTYVSIVNPYTNIREEIVFTGQYSQEVNRLLMGQGYQPIPEPENQSNCSLL